MRTRRPAKTAVLLFEHPDRKVRRTALREFWEQIAEEIAPGRPATCMIATDSVLCDLNTRFRHKKSATDVLSFPAPEGGEELGEIAISLDRAEEQAVGLGHTIEEELRVLMLHGLLHLTGLDHEKDSGEMERIETRWRKRLGLPQGLIERVSA